MTSLNAEGDCFRSILFSKACTELGYHLSRSGQLDGVVSWILDLMRMLVWTLSRLVSTQRFRNEATDHHGSARQYAPNKLPAISEGGSSIPTASCPAQPII